MCKNHVISEVKNPKDNGIEYFHFFCPACLTAHIFQTPDWKFNGDMVKPTITPSILIHENKDYRKITKDRYGHRCHSFVTGGMIRFLGDCTHTLAGQTVPLRPFIE